VLLIQRKTSVGEEFGGILSGRREKSSLPVPSLGFSRGGRGGILVRVEKKKRGECDAHTEIEGRRNIYQAY